ncbi:hypothetical protein JOB18_016290 [Solea senegalensis]|uniref:Uncharacterized protein n=1 Tax=Solea senegalensis TaxID=28829 RepID=A0AAV6QZD7_SOLSE|nr:hypothetical protein JOB18_016290 [Solea senegalensis]
MFVHTLFVIPKCCRMVLAPCSRRLRTGAALFRVPCRLRVRHFRISVRGRRGRRDAVSRDFGKADDITHLLPHITDVPHVGGIFIVYYRFELILLSVVLDGNYGNDAAQLFPGGINISRPEDFRSPERCTGAELSSKFLISKDMILKIQRPAVLRGVNCCFVDLNLTEKIRRTPPLLGLFDVFTSKLCPSTSNNNNGTDVNVVIGTTLANKSVASACTHRLFQRRLHWLHNDCDPAICAD